MKLDKHERAILNKQFQIVGFKKFDPKFVAKHTDWFQERTWVLAQEEAFGQWFKKYMRKNFKMTKAQAEQEWVWWNLAYGWKNLVDEDGKPI